MCFYIIVYTLPALDIGYVLYNKYKIFYIRGGSSPPYS